MQSVSGDMNCLHSSFILSWSMFKSPAISHDAGIPLILYCWHCLAMWRMHSLWHLPAELGMCAFHSCAVRCVSTSSTIKRCAPSRRACTLQGNGCISGFFRTNQTLVSINATYGALANTWMCCNWSSRSISEKIFMTSSSLMRFHMLPNSHINIIVMECWLVKVCLMSPMSFLYLSCLLWILLSSLLFTPTS